jgi:hypothetical protein
MEPGERQLHLGFDAARSGDPAPGSLVDDGVEQRRLPDARITAEHQHAAPAGAGIRDELIEDQGFGLPPSKP